MTDPTPNPDAAASGPSDLPVRADLATGQNAARPPVRTAAGDDPQLLGDVAADDTDRGWGEDLEDRDSRNGRDEQWYQRERPPHWE